MPDLDNYVRGEVERMAGSVDSSRALSEVARRVRRRRVARSAQKGLLVTVVLVGTVLGTFGLFRFFRSSSTPIEGATSLQIASTTVGGDLRVVLTADRESGAAAATVWMTVSIRRSGIWRTAGDRVAGARGTWTWDVITARGGVCELSAADAPTGGQVEVSLATSGGDGCSAPLRFGIEHGRLVAR